MTERKIEVVECEYCHSMNRGGIETCISCGAPLPKTLPAPPIIPALQKNPPAKQISTRDLEQIRKVGEEVDRVAGTALSVYAYFWRTLAEAAIIAITACGIGVVGGATGAPVLGIVGAAAIGFAVGWAIKIYYFVLLSAPAGFVIGAAISTILWLIGLPAWMMPIPIILSTCTAALLGSRRVPYRQRNIWEKLRPCFGTIGGAALGLVGTGIGAGIRAAVMAFL